MVSVIMPAPQSRGPTAGRQPKFKICEEQEKRKAMPGVTHRAPAERCRSPARRTRRDGAESKNTPGGSGPWGQKPGVTHANAGGECVSPRSLGRRVRARRLARASINTRPEAAKPRNAIGIEVGPIPMPPDDGRRRDVEGGAPRAHPRRRTSSGARPACATRHLFFSGESRIAVAYVFIEKRFVLIAAELPRIPPIS